MEVREGGGRKGGTEERTDGGESKEGGRDGGEGGTDGRREGRMDGETEVRKGDREEERIQKKRKITLSCFFAAYVAADIHSQALLEKTPLSGPGALKTRKGRKRRREDAKTVGNGDRDTLENEYQGEWDLGKCIY